MSKKVFLIIKPRKIEGVTFVFSKEISNIKDADEIFEEQLEGVNLENYMYILDCCGSNQKNELFSFVKDRLKKYREDIHYLNETDLKYVNFDYYQLFEMSQFLPNELVIQGRYSERKDTVMDFVTKIYNDALKTKELEGDAEAKRLSVGIKLNAYLNANSNVEYILVKDSTKVTNKPNIEYITVQELTVIGVMQEKVLQSMIV